MFVIKTSSKIYKFAIYKIVISDSIYTKQWKKVIKKRI